MARWRQSRSRVSGDIEQALVADGEWLAVRCDASGLIPSKLGVSPAGNLLCEREVFAKLLALGAIWVHTRALNAADKRYGRKASEEEPRSGR